jgi:Zn-dependent peptidase ImmA (M78 family)
MSDWDKIVEHLKSECPIRRHRLVVQRRKLKDKSNHGMTALSSSEKTITIIVNTRFPWDDQVHTLLHEWGHAMWFDDTDWHDNKWGRFHSMAYRAWEEMS